MTNNTTQAPGWLSDFITHVMVFLMEKQSNLPDALSALTTAINVIVDGEMVTRKKHPVKVQQEIKEAICYSMLNTGDTSSEGVHLPHISNSAAQKAISDLLQTVQAEQADRA